MGCHCCIANRAAAYLSGRSMSRDKLFSRPSLLIFFPSPTFLYALTCTSRFCGLDKRDTDCDNAFRDNRFVGALCFSADAGSSSLANTRRGCVVACTPVDVDCGCRLGRRSDDAVALLRSERREPVLFRLRDVRFPTDPSPQACCGWPGVPAFNGDATSRRPAATLRARRFLRSARRLDAPGVFDFPRPLLEDRLLACVSRPSMSRSGTSLLLCCRVACPTWLLLMMGASSSSEILRRSSSSSLSHMGALTSPFSWNVAPCPHPAQRDPVVGRVYSVQSHCVDGATWNTTVQAPRSVPCLSRMAPTPCGGRALPLNPRRGATRVLQQRSAGGLSCSHRQ